VYKDVQGHGSTCKDREGVKEHVRPCKSLRGHGGSERACEALQEPARACKGM